MFRALLVLVVALLFLGTGEQERMNVYPQPVKLATKEFPCADERDRNEYRRCQAWQTALWMHKEEKRTGQRFERPASNQPSDKPCAVSISGFGFGIAQQVDGGCEDLTPYIYLDYLRAVVR